MENKIKVLFVCVRNAARSQLAEAFLKKFGGDKFYVESAGLEPGALNPIAVEVMKEIGIDISNNRTKSVFDFFKQGKLSLLSKTILNHYMKSSRKKINISSCPRRRASSGFFSTANSGFPLSRE